MGFQVDGDRQKGSRISLFGGRQMGPHISCLLRGIARWDSKLFEIARRDLIFCYFGGRHMGPHISCLLKGIARWDSKLIKGDRQKGSRVSLLGGR